MVIDLDVEEFKTLVESGVFKIDSIGINPRDLKYFHSILSEAKYKGREVELNKPFRTSGPKKFSVYVKNKNNNIIKVNFGQKGMKIKGNNPEKVRNFRKRHNCKDKKDKTKPGYWSCNIGRYGKLLGFGANFVW